MKKFVLLLTVLISAAAFPAEPAKAPAKPSAPALTAEQKLALVQIENQYLKLSQQLTNLQQQLQGVQKHYQDFSADLCKSDDGKKYMVDITSDDPFCREAPVLPIAKTPVDNK